MSALTRAVVLASGLVALAWPGTARADDEWGSTIQKGMRQEGVKTDAEKEQEENVRARFARTRPFVLAGLGWAPKTRPYSDREGYTNASGYGLVLGAGLRAGGGRWSAAPRLLLGLYRFNGNQRFREEFNISTSYNAEGEAHTTGLMLGVDVPVRVRPVSFDSAWYVGLGPRLAYWSYTEGGFSKVNESFYPAGASFSHRSLDMSGSDVLIGAVLESGAYLGADQEWDLGAQLFAGNSLHGELAVDVRLVLGRALF